MSGMFGETRTVPTHKSVEWYTPEWVFDALGIDFDLDPASPHDMETAVPAATKYTVFDDGLKKPWFGRVWMNPPYGPETGMWIRRMAQHGNGIALVFSRTDASWFQDAMRSATAVLFVAGRVEFVPGRENAHKKSRCGAGTALLAFGAECANALRRMGNRGVFIEVPNEEIYRMDRLQHPDASVPRCVSESDELTCLRAEVARLSAALKPFADAFEAVGIQSYAGADRQFARALDANLITPSQGISMRQFREAWEAIAGRKAVVTGKPTTNQGQASAAHDGVVDTRTMDLFGEMA